MKVIFIAIIVLIALLDFALVVACSRFERREEYEAYERWKKRREGDE